MRGNLWYFLDALFKFVLLGVISTPKMKVTYNSALYFLIPKTVIIDFSSSTLYATV